ncbi:ThiF family adenylyltransferase [Actinotalea sp. M2MS4P-6]|uniref:ThiF family adenylyltransferase n=1 Tax=Actinotalea sp. M2MS4P-6 TaxID=2983762 RepID=UPI0021E48513|nr:ThiF family adenylyltransferase [Actinotalea sp. M2MS4P-6]MCV2393785.1 ThiF family adenylyltransferase [Actinotalea sp. M2MS4P-6]
MTEAAGTGAVRLPALVEPGPPLDGEQVRRWSRHLLMPELGEIGQRRLRAARVCVVGAGGLGAPVLQYLAAAGVGRLGVVDGDEVELSNLQRQVLFTTADVGRPKAEVAAQRIAALDPGIGIDVHPVRLVDDPSDLFADYDLVVDATDGFVSRYLVNDACVRAGVPEVWGTVLRFDAQVSDFWGRPPDGVPPVQLRDVFPEPPPAGDVPSCAEAGVLGALCGQVGSLMAVEVVKLVTGIPTPLYGRVLVVDALSGRTTQVPVAPWAGMGPPGGSAGGADPARPTRVGPTASLGEVRPRELADLLAAGSVTLVDVREPYERATASIEGAIAVPLRDVLDPRGRGAIPTDLPVVVFCHLGVRSRQAGLALAAAGWDASHLVGGIDAWSTEVDPSVPRY